MQKHHLLILAVIACFTSCNAVGQVNRSGLILEGRQLGTYFQPPCDSSYIFLFEAQIINYSNVPKEFVAYSCLTAFNFLTDNNEVNLIGNPCSENAPLTFRLASGDKLTIPLILNIKQSAKKNIDSIRIGFVFLAPQDFSWETFRDSIAEKKMQKTNILWSEPVSLQLVNQRQWTICNINNP